MPQYIDKDALIEKLKVRHEDLVRDYGDYDNYVMGFQDAIELLENAPVADVQEVKHAKNIQNCFKWTFECSLCHWCDEDMYYIDASEFKFCPNCGAKMQEDDE